MNQKHLSPTPPAFLKWLDNALARKGWNDQQLAENARLPLAAISHARNGQRLLDAAACRALAQALDAETQDVLQLAGHGGHPPTAISATERLMATFQAMNDQDRRALLELAVVMLFRRARKP